MERKSILELKTGMTITIFDDTDIRSYVELIKDCGYKSKVWNDRIEVGEKLKPKFDSLQLARLLRKKRKGKQITREELAKILQVGKGTVYDWEVGKRSPNRFNLDLLKQVLDITDSEVEECRK